MRAWLRDTAGGLPPAYWYLWSGLLINRLGGFAVLFLSLYLTAERGTGPALTGLIVGTYGIGGVLGTLLGGVLTDRRGRRFTLIWSHVACGLTLAGLALSSSLVAIAVLCALLGLTQSMPGPAFVAAIIDIVPVARRSRAFNLEFWAFNIGTAGASLVAGVLAEWSYTGMFLIDAASALVAASVIAWKVPETLARRTAGGKPDRGAVAPEVHKAGKPRRAAAAPTGPGRPDHEAYGAGAGTDAETAGSSVVDGAVVDGGVVGSGGRRAGMGVVLTDRVFLVFAGLTLLQALLYTQTSTIVPLAMAADGLSPSAYGLVTALGGALIVIGQLFVPRFIDGRRKARVLALAITATGLGLGVLAFADALPVYLAAAVVWTIGSMLAAPPNAEINSELAPVALRGRYQAVFYLTFPAASFLAPSLGGAGLQFFGDWHWVIVAAVGAVAAGLHLAAGPARERHVAKIRDETSQTAALPG